MCGIAGIVKTGASSLRLCEVGDSSRREDLARIAAMNRAQSFRGPDASYRWSNGRVSLGCVRLQICGDEVDGRQPLPDHLGGWTVFNGEIYDHQLPFELPAAVREPGLNSDGWALAAALAHEGPQGASRVWGMFAAARFEPRDGSVLLVRDAMGQKPLYLRKSGDEWVFASTLAAIHAGSGPLAVREQALVEYAVFRSVGGHQSAFEGVSQVPPGCWVRINADGSVQRGRWWTVPETPDNRLGADQIRRCLDVAIAQRADPEHELALFLSGGLDSAIITASLHHQRPRLPKRVFTVGYDHAEWQDERHHAQRLAESLGIEHVALEVRCAELPELLEAVAVATEDPNQDPVTVPTLKLCRAAAACTKVALTGDGSDEIWGGYSRFDDCPTELDRYLERTMTFLPADLDLETLPASYLEGIDRPGTELAPLDRIMRLEASNRLPNYHLSRVDKIGMSVGLEVRSPFMDSRVVELGFGMTAEHKRPAGMPKGRLLEAYRHDLPEWLLRRSKQPFSVPIDSWLCGDLEDFAYDLLAGSNAHTRALLDARPWLARLATCAEGPPQLRAPLAARVWSLLQLEIWLRCFAVRVAQPSPWACAAPQQSM